LRMVVLLLFLAGPVLVQAEPPAPAGKVSKETRQLVERELAAFAKKLSAQESLDGEVATELLRAYLNAHPEFYGAAFAFAPVEKGDKVVKSAPYVYRQETGLVDKNLIGSYDYSDGSQQWYTNPLKTGKALWSDPYFDAGGGNAWMITYSIPLYRAHNPHCPVGVVTTDLVMPAQ